ncbi:unnamed protein product [Arabis nemorensis]|uniref:NAC domain-containing protein n=1 Tax=Arabis nemorensis TaxID=586526 RepID=A0A565CFP2_9BRAS|nr:unnamed protein product [Arabis nemorensis]
MVSCPLLAETIEPYPALPYVRPPVTIHCCEWTCDFAVLAFQCSCDCWINVRVFRNGTFLFHSNPDTTPQRPNVETNWLAHDHLLIRCTCALCNTGCRFSVTDKFSKLKTRDKEWYFISAMDKKHDTGTRMSRKSKEGYWKATGKDREVHGGDQLIGMIKTLVFHKGRAPEGRRTDWVIHEYGLVENEPEMNEAPQMTMATTRFNRFALRVAKEVPQESFIDLNELPREFEIDDDPITDYTHQKQYHDNHNEDDDIESHKSKYVAEALPLCLLDKEAPLPPKQYKRRRNSSGNYSNKSSHTTQDHDSSTTTTVETTNITVSSSALTDKDTVTALLELALPGCSEKKMNLLVKKKEQEQVATMVPEASSSPTKSLKLDLMKAETRI